ncbi:MAG: hypothetical protein AAF573_22035 [Bacteroidota bacterium]
MIFSFGGASAIGKTTLCEAFSDTHLTIPEVNLLFQNEERAGKLWYYEKQVERYRMAKNAKRDIIFDGDIFQPIWYNWIYGYPKVFASKEETQDFYLKKIQEGEIAFPDLYLIFYTAVEELRKRKERDKNRRRRNFEKHIQLIEPHKKYFNFLKKETAIPVAFVEYRSVEATKIIVSQLMKNALVTDYDAPSEFEKIIRWLERN